MTTKIKPKKAKEWKETWDTLTDDIIKTASEHSVHYSFKYINSNLQGGIRLSKDLAIKNIPYVSGITFLAFDDLPVDYYNPKFPSMVATVYGYIRYLKTEQPDNEHINLFNNSNTSFTEIYTNDLSGKNCRLRQILIPLSNSKYLSTTPVSPAGFNSIISKLNKLENKTKIPNVLLGYGGTQAQNAGSFANIKDTKALVMFAPTETPALRYAYSVFYKGVQFIFPYNLLIKLKELIDNPDVIKYTTKKNTTLKDLIKSVYQQSKEARDTLEVYKDEFFDTVTNTYTLDDKDQEKYFINFGLINKNKRDKEWKDKFSKFFVQELCKTSFIYNKKTQSLNLDDSEIEILINEVEKLL